MTSKPRERWAVEKEEEWEEEGGEWEKSKEGGKGKTVKLISITHIIII